MINKSDQKALLISDVFRAQHTQSMKDVMTANNCLLQKVLANITHHLQPLDISINGHWYAKNIVCQLNRGVSSDNVQVDTRLTVIRACTLDQRTCYIFEREAGGHKEEMADGTYNSCM